MTGVNFLLIALPAFLKVCHLAAAVAFQNVKVTAVFGGADLVFIVPIAFLAVFLSVLRLSSKAKPDGSEITVQIMLGVGLWIWALIPFVVMLVF